MVIKAMEKQRHEGKQEIEGLNSKDCLSSLKIRIQDIIKLEIEKLSVRFLNRGRRRILKPEIVGAIQKLNEAPIGNYFFLMIYQFVYVGGMSLYIILCMSY